MVRIGELLQAITVKESMNHRDLEITGVSYHSQKVSQGDLFVCVKGYKTDGHKYLSQAISKGAAAAVVEDYQESMSIPQYIVGNSRQALAQLGAAFYRSPSEKMKMIGITATNGKTTTSYMTNAILENHGFRTGLIGTVSIKNDDSYIPSELTTPESLDLQNYLAQMADNDVSHVSMEVSSIAMDMYRVETVDYDIVMLNNVSREHLADHGSFENYFAAKSKLIRNAREGSFAVLNLDCPYSSSLIGETMATPVTYGVKSDHGHLTCRNLDLSTGRAKFTVEIVKPFYAEGREYEPCQFDMELAVPGLHSVYNSMAAITAGLLSGVSISTIQETLRTFGGVERRFEMIYDKDVKVLDDHFANAGNINVTLETLKYMDFNNLHLIYAIRGARGIEVNRENAETIAEWATKLGVDEITATSSVSHVTEKDKVQEEEVEIFQQVMEDAGITVHLYDELPEAITHALASIESEDLVLLGGCQGMDHGAEIALHQLNQREAGKVELRQTIFSTE
ncbi:Mur ligase family protein [Thalassobacillus pellis]|uniref:Mur ligase family protein n=1 Tax=Thalassobacillus pellis TaxID=748008 RepID=UPI0019619261|nr:UDP-N-acetylmuramyl-tripeptide synthetase [Thalassobacillus pellis]MBM7552055.1 UDP-N-acetylmuramoyl-L-alanyl-D-glutamate--2,6-diaminopimelate ligase [Thalassobacillus pellis]